MASDLRRFLDRHRFKRSDTTPRHTHTNMRAWRGRRSTDYIGFGSYYISPQDYPRFLQLFTFALRANRRFCVGITEVPLPVSSFVLDADWKVPDEAAVQAWRGDDSPIVEFATLVQSVLKRLFDVADATVYCLMKPKPRRDGSVWRDGLHLHCPTVPLSFPQKQLARSCIMEDCRKRNFFPDLEQRRLMLPKSLDQIIDQCVADDRCGWMLFRCCKPDSHPYRIVATIKHSGAVDRKPRYRTSEVTHLFSMRIPNRKATATRQQFEPMVKTATRRRKRRKELRQQSMVEIDRSIRIDDTTHEELRTALTTLLSVAPQTARDWRPWFLIGAVIHNHEPEHGFETFLWFSRQGGDAFHGRADVHEQWKLYRRTANPSISLVRRWIANPDWIAKKMSLNTGPSPIRERMVLSDVSSDE